MSAAAAPLTRPSLNRLVGVELRKAVDTRAGRWLLAVVALLTLATAVACTVTGSRDDHDLRTVLSLVEAPSELLLPIAAILLVSSEWNQRTALVTFALVPRREVVYAAKLLAAVVLGIAALLFCLVVSVAAVALTPDGSYDLAPGILAQTGLSLVLAMTGGVAFGAVFLASAPAIVAFFVLPTAWAALGSLAALKGIAGWLDGVRTLTPLTEELLSADQWARAGITVAVWTLLPVVIGGVRIVRGEVG